LVSIMRNMIRKFAASRFGRFLYKEDASVAVEYAILLPLFITMVIGGLEIGRIYMVNTTLEGAITNSTRIAMTGALPAGYANRNDYIEAIVLEALSGVGVTENVVVTMKTYDSFTNIGEEEPYVDVNNNQDYDVGECFTDINDNGDWDADMGAIGVGGEENIMVMMIDVELPFMTGIMNTILNGSDSISLSAATAIRNEPFGGVAWTPSDNVICT